MDLRRSSFRRRTSASARVSRATNGASTTCDLIAIGITVSFKDFSSLPELGHDTSKQWDTTREHNCRNPTSAAPLLPGRVTPTSPSRIFYGRFSLYPPARGSPSYDRNGVKSMRELRVALPSHFYLLSTRVLPHIHPLVRDPQTHSCPNPTPLVLLHRLNHMFLYIVNLISP